ncbi:MAG: hypothetical protein RQ756_05960 [Flavobacteriaceae bacterium]|nr:hypothetical protein [Flavobacteriaceae bacterium]
METLNKSNAMSNLSRIFVLFGLLMFFTSCGEDDSDGIFVFFPNGQGVDLELLCNGTGTADWMPLAVGNRWIFVDANTSSNSLEAFIIGQVVIDNLDYFQVRFDDGATSFTELIRIGANGDVLIRGPYQNSTGGDDFIFIKANPTPGEEWEYFGDDPANFEYFRSVQSLSSSLSTNRCDYDDVAIINEIARDTAGVSTLISTQKFKQGLGLVEIESLILDNIALN